MANYVDSNLEAAVARFVGTFDGGMERNPFTEYFTKLIEASDFLFPDAQAIRDSAKRDVKAKIAKTIIATADGTRSCTMSGAYGDSVTSTLNWTTSGLTGQVSMKQHQDNAIGLQEAIAKRIADLRRSCLTKMETDAQTWFAASRSTSNAGTSYGTFNATNDVFEIAVALATTPGFLNIASQMMIENRYKGANEIIVNGYTYPQLKLQAAQGTQNATNSAFQFENWQVTNGVGYTDANYPNWFGYCFQTGLVGVLNWLPKDYREPLPGMSTDGNVGLKQSFADPEIPGLTWAMKTKVACVDTSASNGGDDDEVLYIQLSTTYSFNYAPTEDGSTPILAIGSV